MPFVQCKHKSHVVGKGWKKCTFYAVREIYVGNNINTEKEWKPLCQKHYEYEKSMNFNNIIEFDRLISELDICPECKEEIKFDMGIPLCSSSHVITGKVQRYFQDRYPQYYLHKDK